MKFRIERLIYIKNEVFKQLKINKYQIMLNSGGEEIMVYLISNEDDKSEEDQCADIDPDEEAEGEEEHNTFANIDNIESQLKNEGSPYDSGAEQNKEVGGLESISVLFQ